MMNKFKEGDIVVGNERSNWYNHTAKRENFVGKVLSVNSLAIEVEVLECEHERAIGNSYTVDPDRFELKENENEIEIGDKVRVRKDVTVEDLREFPRVTHEMWPVVSGGRIMMVKGFTEESVTVEENDDYWNTDWLEVVEKAPKVKYFDARKTYNYQCDNLFVGAHKFIKYHGMKIDDIKDEDYRSYFLKEDYITTEKPEPLKIINGEVL